MKTKTSLVLCVTTVWLFGCATPVDVRARTPSLELTSSRPAKPVAVCIADRWENSKPFLASGGLPINMRPTPDGYTVSAIWQSMLDEHTALLADINDTPSGSTTRYFKNAVIGEGSYDNAVKECQ